MIFIGTRLFAKSLEYIVQANRLQLRLGYYGVLYCMAITVKFFASLREQMGCVERCVEYHPAMTVQAVWAEVSEDKVAPADILVAVNLEYADWSSLVKEHDEVAFFPPVTGG